MTGEEGQCHVTADQGHMIGDPVIGGITVLELDRNLEENHDPLYEDHTVKN